MLQVEPQDGFGTSISYQNEIFQQLVVFLRKYYDFALQSRPKTSQDASQMAFGPLLNRSWPLLLALGPLLAALASILVRLEPLLAALGSLLAPLGSLLAALDRIQAGLTQVNSPPLRSDQSHSELLCYVFVQTRD